MNVRTNSTRLLAIAASLCLGSAAYAGFNNGGFETGDFTGWTVRQGFNNQGGYIAGPSGNADPLANVVWGMQNYWGTAPAPVVVDKAGYTDTFFPLVQSMFEDNKMAKLNDIVGNSHVTQISQTGIIDASDFVGGATSADLYINWAGIMDNPGHYGGADPWFIIDVYRGSTLAFEERHYSTDPGWVAAGIYYGTYDQVYRDSGQVHLAGLALGEQVTVTLSVADCAWGGHGAYAYLDGIGTSYVPPPPGTPDGGLTALLLIPALAGIVALRRRLS